MGEDSDDDSKKESTITGNFFCIISACCYGLYAVHLKRRVPSEEEDSFQFSHFLGFVGVFNTVLLIPIFFILHYTGIETFEWPNNAALVALSVNAIIGTVISDYAWARSVVLMGPLLTTLGIALTIPISMIVDAIFIS